MSAKSIRVTFKALLAACLLSSLTACVSAGTGYYAAYSVQIAPPPIPRYVQPLCPGAGYIWQPGYWAWGNDGYYWDSGEWVLPPQPGLLWTPGYWDFDGDSYVWIGGHWGATVGYYGDIDYGYGYFGTGFDGGYWDGDRFFYNAAVLNIGLGFNGYVYRRDPDFGRDRGHFWGRPDWHDGFHEGHRGDRQGDFGRFGGPDHHGDFNRFQGPAQDLINRRPVFHQGFGVRQGPRFTPQVQHRAPMTLYRPQIRPMPPIYRTPSYRPQYRAAPRFDQGAMRSRNFAPARPRMARPMEGDRGNRRPPMRR